MAEHIINSNCNVVTYARIHTIGKVINDTMQFITGEVVSYDEPSDSYVYNFINYRIEGKELLAIAAALKVNQIVNIIGFAASENLNMNVRCSGMRKPKDESLEDHYSGCGEKVTIPGCTMTVVRVGALLPFPEIYASADDAREILRNRFLHVSNSVTLIGRLWNEPKMIEPTARHRDVSCKYGVAIHKPGVYRSIWDRDEKLKKASFVWVQSFGAQAEKDLVFLQQSSLVSVSGTLQFRKEYMTANCPNCGEAFEYPVTAVEILATNSTMYCADTNEADSLPEENVYKYITLEIEE